MELLRRWIGILAGPEREERATVGVELPKETRARIGLREGAGAGEYRDNFVCIVHTLLIYTIPTHL